MKEFDVSQSASIVSVTDKVRPLPLGAAVSSVYFLGDNACFVGTEEKIAAATPAGEISQVEVHFGAILCAASDGARIVTGGDDGKLIALNARGETSVLATDAKRRWVDCVALHPDGAFAWSAGKTAFVRSGKAEEKSFDAPSTVGGLAFAPKGLRVAIAHYGGVTLWFPNMAAKPEFLEWAGSHLGVVFSADTIIVWPFTSKDGPMGKEPAMLAPLQARVSAVACHPKQDIMAAGYSDGTILMIRLEDGAEILVRRNKGAAVAAIAWNAKGTLLAFADEEGDGGLLEL